MCKIKTTELTAEQANKIRVDAQKGVLTTLQAEQTGLHPFSIYLVRQNIACYDPEYRKPYVKSEVAAFAEKLKKGGLCLAEICLILRQIFQGPSGRPRGEAFCMNTVRRILKEVTVEELKKGKRRSCK